MTPGEDLHLGKSTPKVRAWYGTLKSFMLDLGRDVTLRSTGSYVAFWRTSSGRKPRIFAYVNFRLRSNEVPRGPHLLIDIPKLSGNVPYEPGFIQPSQLRGWKTDMERIWVDTNDKAERAKPFIAQAYGEV